MSTNVVYGSFPTTFYLLFWVLHASGFNITLIIKIPSCIFFFILSILERITNPNKQADKKTSIYYNKKGLIFFKLYVYDTYEMRIDVQCNHTG